MDGADPLDIGSFLWGMVAGAAVTVALGAAALYLAWPFLVKTFAAGELARAVKEVVG